MLLRLRRADAAAADRADDSALLDRRRAVPVDDAGGDKHRRHDDCYKTLCTCDQAHPLAVTTQWSHPLGNHVYTCI
jgi:hypothetical protein